LCVDDYELIASLNAAILRNEGYEALACSDPLRAASVAKSEQIDLAILDYEMPLMSGAELAALCKAVNPAIKVILFSGRPTLPNRQLALVDLCVEKSSSVEVLLDAIESLLAESETQAECASQDLQQRRSCAAMRSESAELYAMESNDAYLGPQYMAKPSRRIERE
jgi:DNA-binding NtrC family response regulator